MITPVMKTIPMTRVTWHLLDPYENGKVSLLLKSDTHLTNVKIFDDIAGELKIKKRQVEHRWTHRHRKDCFLQHAQYLPTLTWFFFIFFDTGFPVSNSLRSNYSASNSPSTLFLWPASSNLAVASFIITRLVNQRLIPTNDQVTVFVAWADFF